MLTIISVTTRLHDAVLEALYGSLASLRTIAVESHLHYTTLTRWRSGESVPKPDSAAQLADALRKRALRSLELAARLEAEAAHAVEQEE